MELWDLYDRNGNKLEKTLDRGAIIEKNSFHLVVSNWIVNNSEEYLIQKRVSQIREI